VVFALAASAFATRRSSAERLKSPASTLAMDEFIQHAELGRRRAVAGDAADRAMRGRSSSARYSFVERPLAEVIPMEPQPARSPEFYTRC